MDIGSIIKNKRIAMGMSQLELSKGICTQGTISNIESSNNIPSTVILKDIAKKLDLNFFDLGFKGNSMVQTVFDKVNKLIARGESEQAYYQLVINLKSKEIYDDVSRKKYYYYLGSTCLIGLGDIKQAKEIFNTILVDFEMSNTVDDILIYVGLGVAEVLSEDLKKAEKWIDKAVELLRNETLFTYENIKEIMKIYFNVAKFYSEIKDYEKAVNLSSEGLFWGNHLNISYYSDYLNYEKGFNLYHLGKIEEAESYYNVAYVLSRLYNNEIIIKTIINDSIEYGISTKLAIKMLMKY